MKIIKPFLVLSFFLLSTIVCSGQVDEATAKRSAEAAAREAEFGPKKLLHVWRREDLEERILNYPIRINGRVVRVAYFFQITTTGNFIISPTELLSVTSTGSDPKQIVAVSAKTGRVFLLHGFDRAVDNFNGLVADAYLKIQVDSDATFWAHFFYQVVFDPDEIRLVFDSMEIKHKAEDYFYRRSAETKAATSYHDWWKGYQRQNLDNSLWIKSSTQGESYLVSIAHSTGCRDNYQIRQLRFGLSSSGQVEIKGDYPLYPVGKGTEKCRSLLDK